MSANNKMSGAYLEESHGLDLIPFVKGEPVVDTIDETGRRKMRSPQGDDQELYCSPSRKDNQVTGLHGYSHPFLVGLVYTEKQQSESSLGVSRRR